MTQALAVGQLGVRTWLARAFVAAVALTVLGYGAASTVQVNLAALGFTILAILSTFRPIGSWRAGRVQAASIFVLTGLVGYAAFQTLPLPGLDFANGAWKSVSEIIGPVNGTISVAPGMTLDALTTLALPFLAFIAALAFFQGDDEALWLWRALAYFGAAYAAFGILQELLFPDQLLFETKTYYVGYLTATFVNRNTAGTFFGLALLLNLALLLYQLRKIRVASFVKRALDFAITWRDKEALALVHAFCCLIIAMALFLTQSRGAVGATFIACVVAVALISTRRLTADKPSEEFVTWHRYATIVAGLLVVVGLFALFAGRSVYRMQEQGSEDTRWCSFSSTIAAIKDNWIFGTGFGAFQDVFPVYRDSDCAGIFGVWDRAHNFFLEGWLGLGLPFLVALAIGYLVLIAAFIRGVKVRHKFRFIPVMGLSALVLASLHSVVDFSLQIPGVGVYFAAIMAATVTVSLGRGSE
jgi:O-antigen ligase